MTPMKKKLSKISWGFWKVEYKWIEPKVSIKMVGEKAILLQIFLLC
jgi:hypothetical protein